MKTIIKLFAILIILLFNYSKSLGGLLLNQKGCIVGVTAKNELNDYLVTCKADLRKIEKNSKAGKRTSISDLKVVITLPDKYIRQEIHQMVIKSELPSTFDAHGGRHEEGLYWGIKDTELKVVHSTSRYQVGEYKGLGGMASPLRIFDKDNSVQEYALDEVFGTAHVHPSGEIDGMEFSQPPSDKDIKVQNKWEQSGKVTGYSIVVAAKQKFVYFYNKDGVLGIMEMEAFFRFG